MNGGVLAMTVMMATVGVASAFAAMPRWLAPPAELAGVVPSRRTIEARQPPVPLIRKPQRTLEVWPLAAVVGRIRDEANDNAAKAAAKAAIEADGYKEAKMLSKGPGGLWRGEGLRGGTRVLLTVDAQGNVAME